jgi:4-hydroxybenzoate polyprenyltransferase
MNERTRPVGHNLAARLLSPPPAGSWRRKVRGYLLLPHLAAVLVVEVATAAFAIIAWGGVPPARVLLPLLLAMVGGQFLIGATNELVDLPSDTRDKPWKPLPSGAVSVRGARAMAVAGLGLMVVFGLPLGLPAFALLALGTGFGLAYNFWLKRTRWSWLPYTLALPLLPIWVFVAVGRPEPRLLLLYPLGALATVGVHFAQALPDTAIDQKAGLRTPTSRLGTVWTFIVAWIAAFSAPLLAWIALVVSSDASARGAIAIAAGVTLLFLATNLTLLARNVRIAIAACFPLVALSAVVSGLAWTVTIAR